jgi:putative membrane protein (TIGR04086 family)
MKKGKRRAAQTGEGMLAQEATRGAAFAMAVTLALLLLFSALLAKGKAPAALLDDFVLLSVLLGCSCGAYRCAGKQQGGVVTAGVVTALAYIALLLLCTLFFRSEGGGPQMIVREMIASVAGGCFGGVLRLHKKTQKSRLRKR